MTEKKKKQKCFRKKSDDVEDRDLDVTRKIIKETKEFQELRKRPNGINIKDLLKIDQEPKKQKKDPLKLETGGYVDIESLKKGISQLEELDQIGTNFAMETNQRDEDAMMLNYVEEQMARHKGETEEVKEVKETPKNAEDALYELPSNIKNFSTSKKTEESISNQMLSGIPEIDLGIEVKIRNIEETEAAKLRLAWERVRDRDKSVSQFVPSNMAVNFVQHNRFNIEENHVPKKLKAVETPVAVLRVGDVERMSTVRLKPPTTAFKTPVAGVDKATDDFHYEKFKKYMRRF